MEVCCICKLRGLSRIRKTILVLPYYGRTIVIFPDGQRRNRSKIPIYPPKIVNKIKELEDEVWRRRFKSMSNKFD
ncbi:hypothetical protein H5410_016717 [Solanum commersonii]|uniref:Uncharacterized protein n=1 Tax=Solanum commersonii TaxID=4109 RepID=A0A9J5ZX13_SOLCO|nr:hypothetical protein H5410_016717 [Solanum commersonii]